MPGYWSISCSSLHHLLWMKQLWQAEGRRTIQKSVFSCPTFAFYCCGSSSSQPVCTPVNVASLSVSP